MTFIGTCLCGGNAATDNLMVVAVTRFAPSPTGYLHPGHAYAALFARHQAGTAERFLMRIEDIDSTRCRPEFEDAIFHDLKWLGLDWEKPVLRQSNRTKAYRQALDQLQAMDLLYPCFCSRREIAENSQLSGMATKRTPDGVFYPGTCRALSKNQRSERMASGAPYALRLDMKSALAITGPLHWHDRSRGRQSCQAGLFGDVVLARKHIHTSYHLAVTVDDHFQGITVVTRGLDLFQSSHVHRLLQALLGLDTPEYHHHRLLTDDDGVKLSKRKFSTPIRDLRQQGLTPEQVKTLIGWMQ